MSDSAETIERVIGFDYREIGPIALARQKYHGLRDVVEDNLKWLILGVVALTLGGWYLGVSLPSAPGWIWVGVAVAILATIVMTPTSWYVAKELHGDHKVLLSEVNARSGDQRILAISRDRLQTMQVINHNGRVFDDAADALHDETINGRTAYECDRYLADQNLAVTSWQAETSNREVRRKKAEIDEIKTKMEREANRAVSLLANHPSIVRDHAREVSNQVIRVSEGIETPTGTDLFDDLDTRLDELDPDDDLGGDGDGPGVEPADGHSDVDVSELDGIEIDLASPSSTDVDDGGDGDDGN